MALKEFRFKGKNEAELKQTDTKQFMSLVTSRKRRSLKRGFTPAQKALLNKIKRFKEGKTKKPVKTHCRDMIILPEMIGLIIHIHNGKEFKPIAITAEMVGLYLGELSHTRQKVSHSAPGIGATKSSSVTAK